MQTFDEQDERFDAAIDQLKTAVAHMSNGQKLLLGCRILRTYRLPNDTPAWKLVNPMYRYALAAVERYYRGQCAGWTPSQLLKEEHMPSVHNVELDVAWAARHIFSYAGMARPRPYQHSEHFVLFHEKAPWNGLWSAVASLGRASALDATKCKLRRDAARRGAEEQWNTTYLNAFEYAVQLAQTFDELAIEPVAVPPYTPGEALIAVKDARFGHHYPPVWIKDHFIPEGDRITVATVEYSSSARQWHLTFNEVCDVWIADASFRKHFVKENSPCRHHKP